MKRRKARKQQKEVSLGGVVRENLPLPFVHYPNHYGTFIGFSKDPNERPCLCSCNIPAIENYYRLGLNKRDGYNVDQSRKAPLNSWYFPRSLVDYSIKKAFKGIASISFVDNICHRCRMSVPSLRYCHEMYGTEFVQNYGWYINQEYFKLGVDRGKLVFVDEICPQKLKEYIIEYREINKKYLEEEGRLNKLVNGPDRPEIKNDEIVYWHNVRMEESEYFRKVRRENGQKYRKISTYVENIVREEFGIKKVGEAWIGESILRQIVEKLFVPLKIRTHYRPEWLEGMEIDVYVEDMKLAFEYQGQQHFFPIKAWGGEASLEKTKKRDKRKKQLFKKLGIRVVYVNYYDPLTEEFIKAACKKYLGPFCFPRQ